jgi:hypothetical protein
MRPPSIRRHGRRAAAVRLAFLNPSSPSFRIFSYRVGSPVFLFISFAWLLLCQHALLPSPGFIAPCRHSRPKLLL